MSAAAASAGEDLARLLPDAVFQLDATGHITYLNPAWETLTGLAVTECLGRPWLECVDARDRARAVAELDALQHGAAADAQCALRLRRQGEGGVWVHLSARAQHDEDGGCAGALGSLHDITALKRREAGLEQRALHDPLTGLPNRTMLHDRLQHRESRAQRQPDNLYAIAYLDLDDFKAVNDRYGHHLGDLTLTAVAHRLLQAVRATATVARYGGDEFVILLDSIQRPHGEHAIQQDLRAALHAPLTVTETQFTVRASLGLALSDTPHSDPRELIDLADQAMYHTKNQSQ